MQDDRNPVPLCPTSPSASQTLSSPFKPVPARSAPVAPPVPPTRPNTPRPAGTPGGGATTNFTPSATSGPRVVPASTDADALRSPGAAVTAGGESKPCIPVTLSESVTTSSTTRAGGLPEARGEGQGRLAPVVGWASPTVPEPGTTAPHPPTQAHAEEPGRPAGLYIAWLETSLQHPFGDKQVVTLSELCDSANVGRPEGRKMLQAMARNAEWTDFNPKDVQSVDLEKAVLVFDAFRQHRKHPYLSYEEAARVTLRRELLEVGNDRLRALEGQTERLAKAMEQQANLLAQLLIRLEKAGV